MTITGLKFHQTGMSMTPYYTIIPVEAGYDVMITDKEILFEAVDNKPAQPSMSGMQGMMNGGMNMSAMQSVMGMGMFGMGVAVPATYEELSGSKSKITLPEEEIRPFFDALSDAGVESWNGFSKSAQPSSMMSDSGSSFSLKLLCEDGTVLKVSGANAYPDNFREVTGLLYDFFKSHEK